MTQPSPADELRAAAEGLRLIEGDLPGWLRPLGEPLAKLLSTAFDTVVTYPEMGDDHDREACDDYACELVGAALAVARALTGSQP